MFDYPRRARNFFEALVQYNISIRLPVEVSMSSHSSFRLPTQHLYQTLSSPGTEIRIDFRYKHSRVKQYL